jgi:GAF domain-containing protein
MIMGVWQRMGDAIRRSWPYKFLQYGIHSERGVFTTTLVLRFAILIGLTLHFGLAAQQGTPLTIVLAQKWSCVCFFGYVVLLGYLRFFHPDLFVSRAIKLLQVVVDVLFFSTFYFLGGDPDSALIALYLLPLILVAHQYNRATLIAVTGLTVLAFAMTLFGVMRWTGREPEIGWQTFWPGVLFLVTLALATRLFRRRQALDQLVEEREQLIANLAEVADSWFAVDVTHRITAVDKRLLAWTGKDLLHTTCFESLRGQSAPCADCPLATTSQGDHRQATLTTRYNDAAGHRFRVQVTATPLPDEGDSSTRAVLSVQNRAARGSFQRKFHDHFNSVDQAVDLLTSELRERTEALQRQLSTVFSASLAAVSADEDSSIERIISETARILGCETAVLRLAGQDANGDDCLILRYAYGWPEGYAREAHTLRLDHESLVVDAFHSSQIRASTQISHQGRGAVHFIEYAARLKLRSIICFPLMVGEEPIGTLSLYRAQARTFTPEEQQLGQALANNLAICAHNFELYHKTSREAEARRRWLDVLHILSQRLAGVSQLDPLFQLVVDTTRERLNAEISSIFLLEDGMLVRKAIAGVENEWFPEESYETGGGLTGRALVPSASDGGKYGAPILENEVDESTVVIQSHLARYQARLPSGRVRHLLAVPLNGRDGSCGVLRVVNHLQADGSLHPLGFRQDDVDLLSTIAGVVAVAVENARLFADASQARDRIETLYNVTSQFSTELDLHSVMETILRLTIASVGAEDGNIFVLDEDGIPRSHIRIRHGVAREVPAQIIDQMFSEGLAGWLLTHKQGTILKDACQDARWLILTPKHQKTRAVIAVPLIWRERVNGLLFLEHSQAGVFTPEHLELVTASATQAAIAIENARLWAQVVGQKRRLEEYLVGMSESMAYRTDLEGLYQMIVHAGARFLNAEECSLYVKDQDAKALTFAASNRQSGHPLQSDPLPISAERGTGLVSYVAATGESLNFASPEEYQAHPAWCEDHCRDCLFRLPDISYPTLLLVPMRNSAGDVAGVLRVQRKEKETFSEFDRDLLVTLANHAAANIERVRHVEQLREEVLQKERKRLQGDLHDTMNILHAGVMLEAENVRIKLEKQRLAEAEEGIGQLLQSSRHVYRDLRGLLENLRLPLQRGEGVIPALQHYTQMIRCERIQFDDALGIALPPDVEYALVRIGQVALHNVVKHARLDSVADGQAQVVLDGQDDLVVLWIEDNGVGFDAQEKLHSEEALGLKSMHWWAESISGSLWIDSQPGRGTRIRVAVTSKLHK